MGKRKTRKNTPTNKKFGKWKQFFPCGSCRLNGDNLFSWHSSKWILKSHQQIISSCKFLEEDDLKRKFVSRFALIHAHYWFRRLFPECLNMFLILYYWSSLKTDREYEREKQHISNHSFFSSVYLCEIIFHLSGMDYTIVRARERERVREKELESFFDIDINVMNKVFFSFNQTRTFDIHQIG